MSRSAAARRISAIVRDESTSSGSPQLKYRSTAVPASPQCVVVVAGEGIDSRCRPCQQLALPQYLKRFARALPRIEWSPAELGDAAVELPVRHPGLIGLSEGVADVCRNVFPQKLDDRPWRVSSVVACRRGAVGPSGIAALTARLREVHAGFGRARPVTTGVFDVTLVPVDPWADIGYVVDEVNPRAVSVSLPSRLEPTVGEGFAPRRDARGSPLPSWHVLRRGRVASAAGFARSCGLRDRCGRTRCPRRRSRRFRLAASGARIDRIPGRILHHQGRCRTVVR
uniref:hypothetical protein n=1 Tax=Amycolatopsis sp. CA-096443 TaxID=3239919 RepID=UPI003F49404E